MRLLQPEKGLGCGGGELAACSQVRLTSASQYVRRYCLKYSCKHYRLTTSWAAQGLLVDYYYYSKLLLAIHQLTTTITTTTTTTSSSLATSLCVESVGVHAHRDAPERLHACRAYN